MQEGKAYEKREKYKRKKKGRECGRSKKEIK
jgi:hypothetical protein